jgi:hydroxymethylbilane synthase
MNSLTLGTRGSALALQQARLAHDALVANGSACLIQTYNTTGDSITNVPLYELGGKALFCKELDQALLEGKIDVAVHSLKDVPTWLPDGLTLAAIIERADPRDALITRDGETLATLKEGAVLGTSSLRRQAQVLALRPDITVVPLRGNVPTRLQKVQEGQVDATILALAGLDRLGQRLRISELFPVTTMLPAVGQGAIALVVRERDDALVTLCQRLGANDAFAAITAERALLDSLGGSCRTPVAGYAFWVEDVLHLHALIASPDGRTIHRAVAQGSLASPQALGKTVAARLHALAGDSFLQSIGCTFRPEK